MEQISFTLNGKPVTVNTDGERMLLWVLRGDLGLTGTKYACGEGYCGACTVLVNKSAVRSCQYPLRNAAGKEVVTIEGLAKDGKLSALQEAFVEQDALQCGYCTPGMIMAAADLLSRNTNPSEADIRHALEGNLCRCTGYQHIVKAVQYAANKMAAAGKAA